MKYGVVVCPKCKNPKVVLLSFKTSKCTRCNKILDIEKLKIIHKTNSESEVRAVIGLINADNAGKYDDFKKMMCKQKF
jgi:ribosomal protein L37AE/L43A